MSKAITKFWAERRWRYNIGLIISGILAFIAYAIVGELLIKPYDDEYEISLFTIFFQGVGYLFMMGVANICYNLGPFVDKRINITFDKNQSTLLFNLGFWFSILLPFLVPIMLIAVYYIEYAS